MSALLALALLAPSQLLEVSGEAKVGAPAPWFAGWTAEQRVINRTRILETPAAGHVLVLFATWCVPCEAGLKQLAAAEDQLKVRGAKPWLVAIGQRPAEVRPWLAARGLKDWPVLYDRFGRVAQTLGAQVEKDGKQVTQLPRTVVMGADGVVRLLVGTEGPDYVELLLRATPPLGP